MRYCWLMPVICEGSETSRGRLRKQAKNRPLNVTPLFEDGNLPCMYCKNVGAGDLPGGPFLCKEINPDKHPW